MAIYQQGDIVLIPFPFTDFSQAKPRPPIIVANKPTRNNDYIVAKITSNLHNDSNSFLLTSNETLGTLPTTSEVRCNELMTVAHSRIIRKYTAVNSFSLKLLCDQIKLNFDVSTI